MILLATLVATFAAFETAPCLPLTLPACLAVRLQRLYQGQVGAKLSGPPNLT
jgi:hypothetical protein